MNDRVMFLLEGRSPFTDWESKTKGRNLVRVPNFALLTAALDTGIRDLGIEVTHVILDGVATATQFLTLLSEVSPDFRGDVLWIAEDGAGFLSGVTAGDGRVLYRLRSEDIEFYLSASFHDYRIDNALSRLAATETFH
ncbi:MAG: hypothetical protein HYU52_16910 [Acidobacteria bacterium]|nr:hypothetical protein [Acidobacteriota bacterium]